MQTGECPGKFTDIHSHILPGVDDGSKDMEMSIRMLHIAEKNGIGQIILTPHNKPMHKNIRPEELREAVKKLQQAAGNAGLSIELYPGSELYYRSGILKELELGKACTMADSSYVLVEFGPMDEFDYIRNGIYQIMTNGFYVILAHAERYRSVCSDIEHVYDLVNMGCYIQLNAESIMGKAGNEAKHFTRQLLKCRLAHFVATDCHSDNKRSPVLADCAKYIEKKCGEEYRRRLLTENPACILADKDI